MNPRRSLLSSFAALALALVPVAACAQDAPMPAELQIRLAVQAAPEEFRDGATVQGYTADGTFTTLREGSNGLICMAPNPAREDFEVSCHHAGLEPYFEMGRELSASGVTGNDRTQARWDAFTAGQLPIPYGSINYILTGESFDATTAEIEGAFLRWVVYTPNATPENTGITARPAPGAPWLMFPGTPGSHIMIVPPQPGG
jgi:hypothetical protein